MCPLPTPEVPCRQFLYLQMVQASLPGVACRRDDGIETAEEWMPSGLTLNQRGSGDDRLISPFHYDSAGEVWGVSWSVHTISRRGPHGTWPPLSMEVTCSLTHFLSFSPFLSHFLHSLNPSRDHPPKQMTCTQRIMLQVTRANMRLNFIQWNSFFQCCLSTASGSGSESGIAWGFEPWLHYWNKFLAS